MKDISVRYEELLHNLQAVDAQNRRLRDQVSLIKSLGAVAGGSQFCLGYNRAIMEIHAILHGKG